MAVLVEKTLIVGFGLFLSLLFVILVWSYLANTIQGNYVVTGYPIFIAEGAPRVFFNLVKDIMELKKKISLMIFWSIFLCDINYQGTKDSDARTKYSDIKSDEHACFDPIHLVSVKE